MTTVAPYVSNYVHVTLDELRDAIDAIYTEETRYGGMRRRKDRDRARVRTRPFYNAVFALSYGFTPLTLPGLSRPFKAICAECGHPYALKNKGMMMRHAMKKHGRTYDSFPSITTLLERS